MTLFNRSHYKSKNHYISKLQRITCCGTESYIQDEDKIMRTIAVLAPLDMIRCLPPVALHIELAFEIKNRLLFVSRSPAAYGISKTTP